jgi:hypothetical protein
VTLDGLASTPGREEKMIIYLKGDPSWDIPKNDLGGQAGSVERRPDLDRDGYRAYALYRESHNFGYPHPIGGEEGRPCCKCGRITPVRLLELCPECEEELNLLEEVELKPHVKKWGNVEEIADRFLHRKATIGELRAAVNAAKKSYKGE